MSEIHFTNHCCFLSFWKIIENNDGSQPHMAMFIFLLLCDGISHYNLFAFHVINTIALSCFSRTTSFLIELATDVIYFLSVSLAVAINTDKSDS